MIELEMHVIRSRDNNGRVAPLHLHLNIYIYVNYIIYIYIYNTSGVCAIKNVHTYQKTNEIILRSTVSDSRVCAYP